MRDEFQCEICGNWTDGRIFRIVEGLKMIVCNACKGFGVKVPRKQYYQRINYTPTRSKSTRYFKTPNQKKQVKMNNIEDLELVVDYRKILKKKRQKLNMTLSEFANSIEITEASYRSIEAGKTDLLIKDAKKIEKKYNIKLIYVVYDDEDLDPTEFTKKSNALTMGDVFFKREKDKKS